MYFADADICTLSLEHLRMEPFVLNEPYVQQITLPDWDVSVIMWNMSVK